MTRTAQWIYAWLLLLPAMALLVLFTHYPAVATVWQSFFSMNYLSDDMAMVDAVMDEASATGGAGSMR